MSTAAHQFDPVKHEYSIAGQVVPSVTQIIQEFGLVNFDFVKPEILARKAKLGSLVHQACHFYDENDLPEDLHPEVAARLEGYKAFRLDTGYTPDIHEFQQIGVIQGMKFGMQLDSIGLCKGKPWIVDIKNAVNASRAWGLQLAFYDMGIPAGLREARAMVSRRQRIAVQLFADGRYKLHTYSDSMDYQICQALLALSHWKRNNKIT